MKASLSRELIAAIAVISIGLFLVLYSVGNYSLGRLELIGPAMFPAITGIAIVACGVGILLAPSHSPNFLSFEVRPTFVVIGAIIAFAVLLDYVGLVLSLFLTCFASSWANKKVKVAEASTLAVGVTALCVVIFYVGLGLPVPLFSGRF